MGVRQVEFGPRSLGARSILADPRDPQMQDRINAVVKQREFFRPFAPAVLEEFASEHFALEHPSPFMLEICQVISPLALPAITHVDGSARVQTVRRDTNGRFAELLERFYRRTGCPGSAEYILQSSGRADRVFDDRRFIDLRPFANRCACLGRFSDRSIGYPAAWQHFTHGPRRPHKIMLSTQCSDGYHQQL